MGSGFNRMNEVVVQQTTQGFCRYLQEQAGDQLAAKGVVIGELVLPKWQRTGQSAFMNARTIFAVPNCVMMDARRVRWPTSIQKLC